MSQLDSTFFLEEVSLVHSGCHNHTVRYCDIATEMHHQVGLIRYYHDLVLRLVGPEYARRSMELEFMRHAMGEKPVPLVIDRAS